LTSFHVLAHVVMLNRLLFESISPQIIVSRKAERLKIRLQVVPRECRSAVPLAPNRSTADGVRKCIVHILVSYVRREQKDLLSQSIRHLIALHCSYFSFINFIEVYQAINELKRSVLLKSWICKNTTECH